MIIASQDIWMEHSLAISFIASRYVAKRGLHSWSFNASQDSGHPSVSNPFPVHIKYNTSTFPMLLYPFSNQPSHVPSLHVDIRIPLCIIRPQKLQRKQNIAFDKLDVDQIH